MARRTVTVKSTGGLKPVQPPPKQALTFEQQALDLLERIAEGVESIQTMLKDWRDDQ